MKKIKIPFICILATLAVMVGCTPKNVQSVSADSEKDKAEIEKLIDCYVETINLCDTALVNKIWSHDAKVSFIGPSGYYSTYNEIRDSLVTALFGTLFVERNLQKDELKISVNGNTAWSEFTWKFNATRTDGADHRTKGRETQIFEKGDDGLWRLVHIHYSAVK